MLNNLIIIITISSIVIGLLTNHLFSTNSLAKVVIGQFVIG